MQKRRGGGGGAAAAGTPKHALSLSLSLSIPRTRHDLAVREVAREKVVVGGHVLVADSVRLWLQFHDPVDE